MDWHIDVKLLHVLPHSHESIRYPFDIVYAMKSWAFVEFQAPPDTFFRIWCLQLSAFKPNVTIALFKKLNKQLLHYVFYNLILSYAGTLNSNIKWHELIWQFEPRREHTMRGPCLKFVTIRTQVQTNFNQVLYFIIIHSIKYCTALVRKSTMASLRIQVSCYELFVAKVLNIRSSIDIDVCPIS